MSRQDPVPTYPDGTRVSFFMVCGSVSQLYIRITLGDLIPKNYYLIWQGTNPKADSNLFQFCRFVGCLSSIIKFGLIGEYFFD